MKNKIITLALSAMLFALCLPAWAQQAGKVPRIGILSSWFLCFPRVSPSTIHSGKDSENWAILRGKTYSLRFDMQKESKISFLILLPNWLSSRWT